LSNFLASLHSPGLVISSSHSSILIEPPANTCYNDDRYDTNVIPNHTTIKEGSK